MLQCIIVTPERTVYDQPAEFVVLTLYDGEIGVAPGHTPMIGRLGCGEMRIRKEKGTGPIGAKHPAGRPGQLDLSPFPFDRYYVEGGFVEVLGDVVTVLTQRAIPAAEIDPAVAREQLQSAQSRRAATAEAVAVRDRAVAQARAQLRVARRT
jgi:F-type H+-transporting ATPase subunit epsilon